jgi:hypothetical protein
VRRILALAVLLAALAGCATIPPPAPAPPASGGHPAPPAPTPGTTVGTTASGGTISVNGAPPPTGAHASAAVDSTPSPEAVAVLKTISEPLGGSTGPRASSQAPGASAPSSVAPPAATPSTAAATADSAAAVPVPEPTQPLGDRPGSVASMPESSMAAAPVAPAPDSTHTPAAATSPDSCWGVQVSAPPEKERADRLADAARSQLLIAMVVEKEAGLYKVRTRDCYSGPVAEDLRRRAVASGFEGAFRFLRKSR